MITSHQDRVGLSVMYGGPDYMGYRTHWSWLLAHLMEINYKVYFPELSGVILIFSIENEVIDIDVVPGKIKPRLTKSGYLSCDIDLILSEYHLPESEFREMIAHKSLTACDRMIERLIKKGIGTKYMGFKAEFSQAMQKYLEMELPLRYLD